MKKKAEAPVVAPEPEIMMENSRFSYPIGMKIFTRKYPDFETFAKSTFLPKGGGIPEKVKADWDLYKEQELTVTEALSLTNLESRRVCFKYIGIENIFKQLKPEKVDAQTIHKNTRVTKEGTLAEFDDTYELYQVKSERLAGDKESERMRRISDFYILRCNCTSTGREYMIYIPDLWNNPVGMLRNLRVGPKPDAIEAVAWTIQVDVPEGQIEEVVRAGDCIMVRPVENYTKCERRHLTKKEYLERLTMES